MRDVEDRHHVPVPSHSKSAQRRQRLARGLRRWDQDRQLCGEATRRIAVVTLTLPEEDPAAAIGLVYRFWRQVRQRWLGTRYFCWLEVQKRGAAHYHAIWLNPPHQREVNLQQWVHRAWGRGRTQVRFPYGQNAVQRELEHAMKYTRKMARKAYEQRYDDVPSQLRTFMSQRLEVPGEVLDDHRTHDSWAWIPPDPSLWGRHEAALALVAHWEHVLPAGGRCSALDYRRPRAPGRAPPSSPRRTRAH